MLRFALYTRYLVVSELESVEYNARLNELAVSCDCDLSDGCVVDFD